MARPAYGGRPTCDGLRSIDVRRWHREGRLHAGQNFSLSWSRGGEPSGSIGVRTEADAVVLMFHARRGGDTEWKSVEQCVPITWTACHLGGRRPWFCCLCGRRVALLYGAGELFACRRCCGLAYESQHESLRHAIEVSERHRKSGCGWEEAQAFSTAFRIGRKVCPGEPTAVYAILTMSPPHDAQWA
jgi:hypothetical protein